SAMAAGRMSSSAASAQASSFFILFISSVPPIPFTGCFFRRARGRMFLGRRAAAFGSLDDALFEDDVGVDGGLAGGDDGVGFGGAIVEGEALEEADLRARLVLFDDGLVLVPDGGVRR